MIKNSIQSSHYNKDFNCYSPVAPDFDRVVRIGPDNEELVTWEPCDNAKIVRENGTVKDWSLENLLKAGISPDVSIHTGSATRLEVANEVKDLALEIDKIVASDVATTPETVIE